VSTPVEHYKQTCYAPDRPTHNSIWLYKWAVAENRKLLYIHVNIVHIGLADKVKVCVGN